MKRKLLFLPLMLIVINGKCQSLALFDTLVNTHRMTLCELVEYYANIDEVGAEFTYYTLGYGKSFYGIKFSDRFFGLLGQWCFVMKEDTLNQYGFQSELTPNTENYVNFYRAADSAIRYFTAQFGKPTRDTAFYDITKINSGIRKAIWSINGQKLLVTFYYSAEKNVGEKLVFEISRYSDYIGNVPVSPWWDGY